MTTPSLPQHDTDELRGARARVLAAAKSQFAWTHSHVYESQGSTQTLSGLPLLAVDAEHPFPSTQNPTAVQVFDIVETINGLLGLLVINVADLVDVGAVRTERPTPPPHATASPPAGRLAALRERIGDTVDAVRDRVHEVVHHVELAEHAVALWRRLTELRHSLDALLDRLEGVLGAGELPPPNLLGELAIAANDTVGRIFRLIVDGDAFPDVLEQAGLRGPASSLEQYGRQFQTFPVPNVAGNGMSDALFARMRVAGPNPLLITRVVGALPEHFPVDPVRFEALTRQTLADAIAAGRAYVVDYAALADVVTSDQPAGQKYSCAPLALFVLDATRKHLRPIAIQLGQQPGPTVPVFYCDEGATWELAKLHVQSADGNYHELISHLGLTHLLIEPFVIATHRNLAPHHPLFRLLLPHFQGTLFINWSAVVSLIAPGGGVDQLLAGTIESDWGVVGTAFGSLDFDAHMLPAALAARGVDDPALLPDYPYRDDAVLLWGAMDGWVREYLSLYYADDAAVADDTELQAWVADLVAREGGRVGGFGEPGPAGLPAIVTRDYLAKVVTMLMFTASAQHATVNFPQCYVMSYAPAMPLATYAPPPTRVDPELTADAILAHLPPLQMANYQLMLGQLLGSIYFTRLGRYDLQHASSPYFADPRVSAPLRRFQARLAEVERIIADRNLERAPYETLLPSRIPQSINI